MGKAILVMNMPESCSKCPFMYKFNGFKKCHLLNCLCRTNSVLSVSEYTKKRVEKCPFRELPERKDLDKQRQISIEADCYDAEFDEDYLEGSVRGWNDCIDAIEGSVAHE